MNKQEKTKNGKVVGRGIEWTDYTWNPISGCKHACRWIMPDGQIAKCYAEDVANGVARHAYPDGFESHYWNPKRLNEPLKVTEPARVFMDSMSDLMGAWIPDEQIKSVLDVCRQAHWHTFQLLTKNAPRLLKFDFPGNVWVGVSSPPDFMRGKQLDDQSKARMLAKSLDILSKVDNITWLSAEPLSWDIEPLIERYPLSLEWVVIGAASSGRKRYQPDPQHIIRLINVLDALDIPVFFKGNLEWRPRREEFPLGESNKAPRCKQCGQYLSGIANYSKDFCTEAHAWAYEIPF